MPRQRTAVQEVAIPTSSLVASAVAYPGNAAPLYRQVKEWQTEAYRHYKICGEARYAVSVFANSISRAVLSAGRTDDSEPSAAAQAALDQLFIGGQTQILRAIGAHLTIAGECFLVGRKIDRADVWEVVSIAEMSTQGNNWTINYGDGTRAVVLTKQDVVIRIWLPDPQHRIEADSPFRPLLPVLTEIEWATRHVFAQLSSRLAGAGLLLLSSSMDFPDPPPVEGAPPPANNAEKVMMILAEAMLTPIKDPGNASSLVPIVLTADKDSIDAAKLMHFWTELDDKVLGIRQDAVRRFALGMDMPPEQMLGMSSNGGTGGGRSNGVSHWGAWQVEEATIKIHIEPMLDVICDCVTISYLQPITKDQKDRVVYDTSRLRLRPDRSKEAFELWDRGQLKTAVLLRETGFNPDTDLPDTEEQKRWFLMKIATGSATPEQVQAALSILGIQLASSTDGTPRESRPAPSLEDHPTRPKTPDQSALIAASEGLVFRALERAGNRLRSGTHKPPECAAADTYLYLRANGSTPKLLEDAWTYADRMLSGLTPEPEKIVNVLDSYCATLLTEQSPHSRERMVTFLGLVQS